MAQEKVLILEDGKIKQKVITFTSESSDNFSYHYLASGEQITIQSGQHMIALNLEVDGFLEVEGCVVML